MSEPQEFEIVIATTEQPKKDHIAQTIASARERLTRFLPRAVEILEELAELSENDRVRLAAAESIADRAGLTKGTTLDVRTSQAEHDIAEQETQALLRRIQENQDEITSSSHVVPLDVLIVHEGDVERHGETP